MNLSLALFSNKGSERSGWAGALAQRGYRVLFAAGPDSALQWADFAPPLDGAVVAMRPSDPLGWAVCRRLLESHPGLPIVLLSEAGRLAGALAGLRAGAQDVVSEPVEPETVDRLLRQLVDQRRRQHEVESLQPDLDGSVGIAGLLGQSAAIRHLEDVVRRIRESEAPVLLTGESGSGKERVARAIHASSWRRGGPFLTLSCASQADLWLEGALFGVEREVLPGAPGARLGLLSRAHGGTLFIDEIGALSPPLQTRLRRALGEGQACPVGSDESFAFNVRIMAATAHDLQPAVRRGEFRSDLFFRLNVLSLQVPPLRDRREDIPLLALHSLQAFARQAGKRVHGFAEGVESALQRYDWPGNARELRSVVQGAVAMAGGPLVTLDDLPVPLRAGSPAPRASLAARAPLASLAEVERRHVLAILEVTGGNKSEAARILGVDRKTLQSRLQRYGVVSGRPG